MARVFGNRVMETSTSTGTGPFALSGAVTGFQRFNAVCASSDTVDYAIYAVDGAGVPSGAWETGRGTYSSANTLTRTTVEDSSSAGAAVSFAAGAKIVILTPTAETVEGLVAGGGGLDLRGQISQAMAAAYTTGLTGGGSVAFNIESGSQVALLLTAYTSSGPSSRVHGVDYVVPTGKMAAVIEYHVTNNVRVDEPFYKHWLRNVTASADVLTAGGNTGEIAPDGLVWADGANNTITFPFMAGTAGDTLRVEASSSGDGNTRTISGYVVLELFDL